MKIICGVYKIQSKIKPERIYIGSALDLNSRFIRHKSELRRNKHNNKKMQNHFNKYGESDFQFIIITLCDKSELINMEQFFIDSYKPYFNVLPTAYSLFGYKHSNEAKENISRINTGRKMTKEQIEKGVIARIGQNTSKGCKRTIEMKKHLSDVKKKKVVYNSIVYNSLKDISDELNIKYSTLYAMLSNRNKNRLNLQYHA